LFPLFLQWSTIYSTMCCSLYMCLNFSVISLLLNSSFTLLWCDRIKGVIPIFLYLLRLTLCPKIWWILEKIQCTCWEEYVSCSCWNIGEIANRWRKENLKYMYIRIIWKKMSILFVLLYFPQSFFDCSNTSTFSPGSDILFSIWSTVLKRFFNWIFLFHLLSFLFPKFHSDSSSGFLHYVLVPFLSCTVFLMFRHLFDPPSLNPFYKIPLSSCWSFL
jgi:hypothetical protein